MLKGLTMTGALVGRARASARPAQVRAANLRKFAATLQARGNPLIDDLVFRALGGHPAALRACRRARIVVGRGRALPFRLGPIENAAQARAAVGVLCAAVRDNKITVRETSALLWRIEQFHTSPFLALVHEFARIEATLAKAAAAIGLDFMFTQSAGPAAARARLLAARRARAAACAKGVAAEEKV
jgi:hypothetical protein